MSPKHAALILDSMPDLQLGAPAARLMLSTSTVCLVPKLSVTMRSMTVCSLTFRARATPQGS